MLHNLFRTSAGVLSSILFLFIFVCIQDHRLVDGQNQILSDLELESAIWLLNQYHVSQVPQNQSLCDHNYFKCGFNGDGEWHIQEIILGGNRFPFANPDPSLQSFYFPELRQLSISNQPYVPPANVSLNVLNYIQNMPNLTQILINYDSSTTYIPNSFGTTLPKLERFQMFFSSLVTIENYFNNTNIRSFQSSGYTIENITFDTSLYLPNMNGIYLDLHAVTDYYWTIDQKSFPKVKTITFQSDGSGIYNVNFNSSIVFSVSLTGTQSSGFNVTFLNTSNLTDIVFSGKKTTLNPPDLSNYPRIINFYFENSSFTTYPFTSFPPTLESFIAPHSLITQIPLVPIIKNEFRLILSNGLLSGSIPFDMWNNSVGGILDFSNNPALQGSIPDSWCDKQLYLVNTSISHIPDCFWCSKFSNVFSYPSQLTPPSNPNCNITFDKDVYPSINGIANVTGNGFGFGSGNNYTLLVRNSMFQILYDIIDVPKPFGVSLNLQYVQFNVVVATISTSNFTLKSPTKTLTISLTYNHYIPHNIVIHNNDSSIQYPCVISLPQTPNLLICTTSSYIIGGGLTMNISNDYNSASIDIISPTDYPLVTSAQLSPNLQTLTLNGNFGPNDNAIITLNNTLQCALSLKNLTTIVCTFATVPQPGEATLQITVDEFTVSWNNMVNIPFPPSTNLKQKCIEETSSCYGHGQCNDQGVCICEQYYYDNCRYYSNPNATFIKNNTKPVASFELDGYQFYFSLVAIQELDSDDTVIKELLVDQWNVTDQSQDELTSLFYQLVINTTSNPTTFIDTNVTTLIEYSKHDRQVAFGDTILSVGSNSIKVSVNISDWKYESIISHLRVVFATIVNDAQTIPECGEDTDIPTFEDAFGSDSYLRVIKNETQFYGRFLSYSYSDGRKTYTRNELINRTRIENLKGGESLAMIGIHLPQCQQCLLDPDFSALIINNQQGSDNCPESATDTWKIAVGVSVGGAVFIALVIATVLYLRDSNKARIKIRAAKSILMKKLNR